MNWEAIGAVGEILGAIAVVASLFYVGRQVKENSNATRGQTVDSIVNSLNTAAYLTIQDPKLLDIVLRGVHGESLDHGQRSVYTAYVLTLLRTVQSAHYQLELGLLDEQKLTSLINLAAMHIGSELGQAFWDSQKKSYDTEFQSYVDRLIESRDTESAPEAFRPA